MSNRAEQAPQQSSSRSFKRSSSLIIAKHIASETIAGWFPRKPSGIKEITALTSAVGAAGVIVEPVAAEVINKSTSTLRPKVDFNNKTITFSQNSGEQQPALDPDEMIFTPEGNWVRRGDYNAHEAIDHRRLLFADDFRDVKRGIAFPPFFDGGVRKYRYLTDTGEYQMITEAIDESENFVMASHKQRVGDFEASIDMRRVRVSNFRQSNISFLFHSDATYGTRVALNTDSGVLVVSDLDKSSGRWVVNRWFEPYETQTINRGDATNNLRVKSVGNRTAIWINGQLEWEGIDPFHNKHPEGEISLGFTTSRNNSGEGRFSNLVVKAVE